MNTRNTIENLPNHSYGLFELSSKSKTDFTHTLPFESNKNFLVHIRTVPHRYTCTLSCSTLFLFIPLHGHTDPCYSHDCYDIPPASFQQPLFRCLLSCFSLCLSPKYRNSYVFPPAKENGCLTLSLLFVLSLLDK